MPSLIVTLGGQQQAKHTITQQRTRLGRFLSNDIVLKGQAVSGKHAVLIRADAKLAVEDLGSKNGTFVGTNRVTRADLQDGDVLRIGEYLLTVKADPAAMAYEPTLMVRTSNRTRRACLRRLDGSAVGALVELNKVVTALGPQGVCIVTIIRRGDEFAIRFTAGSTAARLNGVELSEDPVILNDGDVIETAGDRLQFGFRELGSE